MIPSFILRAYRWLRFYRLHGMSPSEVAKHRNTLHIDATHEHMNMSPTEPKSYVIQFLNGNYNRGYGFEIANVTGATLYPTKEAAELVASHLQGDIKIHELPIEAPDTPLPVGPRWIAREVPSPTSGQLATLRVILDNLRGTAEFNHKLEGEATDAQSREWHALARYGAEAHARVMLDMLTYFGVKDLPAPLNLPRHPNLKVTP